MSSVVVVSLECGGDGDLVVRSGEVVVSRVVRRQRFGRWLDGLCVLAGRWRGDGGPDGAQPGPLTDTEFDGLVGALGDVLLAGDVGGVVAETAEGLTAGAALTVAVSLADGTDRRLWDLPWELVRFDGVVGSRRVRVIRHVGGGAVVAASGRCRFGVVAGPRQIGAGEVPLPESLVGEQIRVRLGPVGDLAVVVAPVGAVSEASLDQFLGSQTGDGAGPLDVLVFDGHGCPDGLWLADDDGDGGVWVGSGCLGELLAGRVRSVVLLACQGAAPRPGGAAGVAETLTAAGVATVALPTEASYRDAVAFVDGFAAAAATGAPLASAVAAAKAVLADRPGRRPVPVTVWQPTTTPVMVAPAATGPRLRVVDPDFGRPGWFVARDGLVAEIAGAVDRDLKTVGVVGTPGSGKSSVLRWWWEQTQDDSLPSGLAAAACAVLSDPLLHAAQGQRDQATSRLVSERVSAGLAGRSNHPERRLDLLEATRHQDGMDLWRGLVDPLTGPASETPFVVLIDEVEQTSAVFQSFLADAIAASPQWFRWVLTSRPDLPTPLRSTVDATVSLSDHRDGDAIETLARRLLDPMDAAGRLNATQIDTLAAEIARRADGMFLWARVVAELIANTQVGEVAFRTGDLVEGIRVPSVADGTTLGDLYRVALQHQPETWQHCSALLRTIVACQSPAGFNADDLADLHNADPTNNADTANNDRWLHGETIRRLLGQWRVRSFLNIADGHYLPFHQSFADWVTTVADGALVDQRMAETHARIGLALNTLRQDGRLGGFDDYAHRYQFDHLIYAGRTLRTTSYEFAAVTDTLQGLARDPAWLIDCVETCGLAELAAQLTQLRTSRNTDSHPLADDVATEPFTSAVTDLAASTEENWPLITLAHRATLWHQTALADEATRRLTDDHADWWQLDWFAGEPPNPGLAAHALHHTTVTAITTTARHDDTDWVISGDADGHIIAWNPTTATHHTIGHHPEGMESVAVIDGDRVVTAGGDGTVRVWATNGDDADSDGLTIGHNPKGVLSVAVIDGDRVVTAGWDGTVRVWATNGDDADSDGHIIGGHPKGVMSVAVLGGDRVVTGGWYGTVRVWATDGDDADSDGLTIGRRPKGTQPVAVLDGDRVVTGGSDGTVRVWATNGDDADSDGLIIGHHPEAVRSVAVLGGDRVVTGGDDGTVRVWATNGDDANGDGLIIGHPGAVSSVAVIDGGRVVAVGSDGIVRVWRRLGRPHVPDAG